MATRRYVFGIDIDAPDSIGKEQIRRSIEIILGQNTVPPKLLHAVKIVKVSTSKPIRRVRPKERVD